MDEIKGETIEHTIVTVAVVVLLAVHLVKFILGELGFGLKRNARVFIDVLLGELGLKKEDLIGFMHSGPLKKQTAEEIKSKANDLLNALFSEDQRTKEEILRLLRIAIYEHNCPSTVTGYQDLCHALLMKCIVVGPVTVGIKGTRPLRQSAFLDAISRSLKTEIRSDMADYLASHFSYKRLENAHLKDIVGIVGIKRGAPWLAIEVAKRLNIFPIAFHRGEPRANAGDPKTIDRFDGELPKNGKVMIIDDSITGGTMVLEAVKDLEDLQIDVHLCLVLFEVSGKHGRETLAAKGIHLLSICSYDGVSNTLTKSAN